MKKKTIKIILFVIFHSIYALKNIYFNIKTNKITIFIDYCFIFQLFKNEKNHKLFLNQYYNYLPSQILQVYNHNTLNAIHIYCFGIL